MSRVNSDCNCACRRRNQDMLHKDLTLVQYNALSESEKQSGIIYFITDIDNTDEARITALENYCEVLQDKLDELESKI